MALILPKRMYDEIIAHTKEGGPEEVCGLIAGQDGRPVKLYRAKNVAENRAITYFMEPHDQLRAFQDMDEHGWELLAIYHSHPSSENYPSQTDVRQAFYPEAYHLIATLPSPSVIPLRAYRIIDRQYRQELLALLVAVIPLRAYRIIDSVITEEPIIVEWAGCCACQTRPSRVQCPHERVATGDHWPSPDRSPPGRRENQPCLPFGLHRQGPQSGSRSACLP